MWGMAEHGLAVKVRCVPVRLVEFRSGAVGRVEAVMVRLGKVRLVRQCVVLFGLVWQSGQGKAWCGPHGSVMGGLAGQSRYGAA